MIDQIVALIFLVLGMMLLIAAIQETEARR